jgi:uncharacterized protein
MEIPIFDTSERERVVEVTASSEEMDLHSEDYSLENDVIVVCTLNRTGDLVRVEGKASTHMTVECARCLEPFPLEVAGIFTFVVKRLPLGMTIPEDEEEKGEDAEEFIYVEHTVTSIDIIEFVRDAIILALPMRVLCSDDCKGLCVVCGTNRNESECGCESGDTDPRWKALTGMVPGNRKK